MRAHLRPPIILFGNTRSGTTIVQKLLAVHPDVVDWYEPRTLWLCADPGRDHDEFDEDDATPRVKRYIRRRFLGFQKRNGARIVMEKTPANIFKVPYVRAIFPEATYLFMVRNPFSFISSVERKWQRPVSSKGIRRRLRTTPVTQLPHYAGRLVRDQLGTRIFHRPYLSSWGPRYKGMHEDLRTHDLLTVIARQWARGSRKAGDDLARFTDGEVLGFRYEDFVEEPIAHLQRLAHHCGLRMTKEMERAAQEWVKADRQLKWHRFEMEDLARILPELTDEMGRHGYEVPAEIMEAVRRADAFPMAGPTASGSL